MTTRSLQAKASLDSFPLVSPYAVLQQGSPMTMHPAAQHLIYGSPLLAVLGSHRVFGRSPLDALCTFCDRHHWHSHFASPYNGDALPSTIYPIDHPGESYPVCVTPLAVAEEWADSAHNIIAHPGDYRITVRPW